MILSLAISVCGLSLLYQIINFYSQQLNPTINMLLRAIAVMLLLCSMPALSFAGKGKGTCDKYYKAKKASMVRYCYIKAVSHSVSGDVNAYSDVIEVNIAEWDKQKMGEIFSFEEKLSADFPNQIFIPTFSWVSPMFQSKAEALAHKNNGDASRRHAVPSLDGKY
jgi:hypothetical protein